MKKVVRTKAKKSPVKVRKKTPVRKKDEKAIVARELALNVARSASDLKAFDIKILNLDGLCSFTDYFVVCSGSSSRHVRSIADKILLDQKKNGHTAINYEGYEKSEWILLDFGYVVAHVFYPESRLFYNIERLWGDAKVLRPKGLT